MNLRAWQGLSPIVTLRRQAANLSCGRLTIGKRRMSHIQIKAHFKACRTPAGPDGHRLDPCRRCPETPWRFVEHAVAALSQAAQALSETFLGGRGACLAGGNPPAPLHPRVARRIHSRTRSPEGPPRAQAIPRHLRSASRYAGPAGVTWGGWPGTFPDAHAFYDWLRDRKVRFIRKTRKAVRAHPDQTPGPAPRERLKRKSAAGANRSRANRHSRLSSAR